jgi:hypothetical protein
MNFGSSGQRMAGASEGQAQWTIGVVGTIHGMIGLQNSNG